MIDVHHGWDRVEGRRPTKGRKCRTVAIPADLVSILRKHIVRTGRREAGLVFGRTPSTPFSSKAVQERADAAWERAGLADARITFHGYRHTWTSHAVAAGLDLKAVSSLLGHANVGITDRYIHTLPGVRAADPAEASQLSLDERRAALRLAAREVAGEVNSIGRTASRQKNEPAWQVAAEPFPAFKWDEHGGLLGREMERADYESVPPVQSLQSRSAGQPRLDRSQVAEAPRRRRE